MELRSYQSAAISSLRSKIASGSRRLILVSPTGSGKTVMASHMIHSATERGRRCLFLAHRKELIDQASNKLDALGIEHGVIKAGHKRVQPWADVQVASVQTLVRRGHFEADLVVVDECHRAAARTYAKIFERFETPPVIVGLTATPYRQRGGELIPDVFDTSVLSATPRQLVEEGHLVNPIHYAAPEGDWSNLQVRSNGEYTTASGAAAMNDVLMRGDIVRNWQEKSASAATIVFAQSIEHSKWIVEQFKDAGVSAEHLDGTIADGERTRILSDFAERKVQIVSNCGVLSEGYDLPLLECIVLARPIRTKGLYIQMVGRVMRPCLDKRMAVVMDHGGNTLRHGFVVDSNPDPRANRGSSEEPSEEPSVVMESPVVCTECNAFIPVGEAKCPHCGTELEPHTFAETIEDLQEIRSEVQPTLIQPPSEPKVWSMKIKSHAYESLCRRCVDKGYKPGWASHAFKSRFGKWPNRVAGLPKPDFFKEYEISFAHKKREGDKRHDSTTTKSGRSETVPGNNSEGWDI